MNKRYNFKTQKGILEHCADLGHTVEPCAEAETAFVGQPATYHIGGDCYADQVVDVVRSKKTGKVTKVVIKRGEFVPKVSANCTSKGSALYLNQWEHYTYLDSLKGSGWVELGVATTHLDPSF
jgi:hypothetical protein